MARACRARSGFDITAASEVMAVLCLAEDLTDLKRGSAACSSALDRATASR